MSSVEEKDALKAGHAPAVKAGGMRITQHRHPSGGDKPVLTPEEEEEFGEATPPKADTHSQQTVVSGVMTKGDKDFPAAAVKQYHDKPVPAKEKRPANPAAQRIQQPR